MRPSALARPPGLCFAIAHFKFIAACMGCFAIQPLGTKETPALRALLGTC